MKRYENLCINFAVFCMKSFDYAAHNQNYTVKYPVDIQVHSYDFDTKGKYRK